MECATTYFSISVYSRSKSMYIPFVLDQMKSQRISILYYVLNNLSISITDAILKQLRCSLDAI